MKKYDYIMFYPHIPVPYAYEQYKGINFKLLSTMDSLYDVHAFSIAGPNGKTRKLLIKRVK